MIHPVYPSMDLQLALTLLRRRAWLVIGLPLLVALLSAATYRPAARVFEARLTFALDIPHSALLAGSDKGDAANTGEALIDDISRVMSGDRFRAAIAKRLPSGIAAITVASTLSANDRHRIADVTATQAAPPGASAAEIAALQADLAAVGTAVVAELNENGKAWFARLGEDDVVVTIVDGPRVTELGAPLRQRLELPLRVLLAFLVALGLAFVLHAYDPRLYGADEAAQAAQAAVLAEIPGRRRLRQDPGQHHGAGAQGADDELALGADVP
jgi:hypothetical protein